MMFKKLAKLEWKGLTRKSGLAQSILMGIGQAYFGICYLVMMAACSILIFELPTDANTSQPLQSFFKYVIYLWTGDLVIRYFFQKMPTTLVKPLLIQNISKSTIVKYCLTKSTLSFFNLVNLIMSVFVFFQFLRLDVSILITILCTLSFLVLFVANTYLVQLLNHISKFALPFLIVFAGVLALDYFEFIEVTAYTKYIFESLFTHPYLLIVLLLYLLVLVKYCYNFYYKNLSLDSAIVVKKDNYTYYNFDFLNRFGDLAPFLKLDLKLLTRNKRTRTVWMMSGLFILYGLLIFTMDMYKDNTFYLILFSVMVSGGFMMLFGQYVPSWDSSYYPLMMTQNIPYRRYLESKWLLMVLGTLVSMLIASFYLFFGLNAYLIIVAVGFYNIGWNCYFSLLTGVFVRSKIDLSSNKNAFGDSKAFNVQTLLLSIPTLALPMLLYVLLSSFLSFNITIIVFIAISLVGILLKPIVFNLIEKLYKSQKYTTIKAYK